MEENRNKKKKAGPVAVMIAVLAIVAIALFCAAFLLRADVSFELPGGEDVSVEYGSEYVDDVLLRVSLPLVGDFVLTHGQTQPVDTHILGSHTLDYSSSFLGKSATARRNVNVVDTTPPEIVLLSREDYSPDWIEGYQEEGFTATDSCDGDITARVETQRGDGYVEYRVTDASGNTATARRDIEYKESLPTLTLVGPETVTISARPRYDDPGCQAVAAGVDLSAYLTLSGEVDSRHAGEYELTYTLKNPTGDSVSVKRRVIVDMEPCPAEAIPEEKTVYLTFDDGPGAHTDALLELLEAYGAKATFFVTGAYSRYSDCIGRAHSLGHSIGVHTYDHNYRSIYSSEENFFADFNAVQQLIYEQTGEYTQLYRFPGGSSNTASSFNPGFMSYMCANLQDMGYRYFDWNVNSGDADNVGGAWAQAERVRQGCAGKHCAVVLFHDVKRSCVEAVEQVLIWGTENGYRFSALDLSSPAVHHGIAN